MSNGELKTAGSKRYEVPWVDGLDYKSVESTIATGVTNQEISLGFTRFTGLEILNDNETTGNDLIIRLNTNSSDAITVKAGESKSINNFVMTALFLTNSSGATISYRILAWGIIT